MILTLEQRVRFNEKFNAADNGSPWTLKGRDYVLEEIWRPLDSYRAWPAGSLPLDALCGRCRDRVGTLWTDPFEIHAHTPIESCAGLEAKPIIATGVNVPRRSGKTTNGLSFIYASLFLEQFVKAAFIASAEDQSETLIENKLASKIRKHPALMKMAKITADRIEVPQNNCVLEVLPKSHGSITGRGFTHIFVDEARDIGARVFGALLPSLQSEHGYKCPRGCDQWGAINDLPPFPNCPKCNSRLRRWHARVLVSSASGLREDNEEKDWFQAWIDLRLEKPDPNVHVWRTTEKVNPSVSAEISSGIRGGFGDVPGLKEHVGVELDNAPLRRGEAFITGPELANLVDARLVALEKSPAPAVSFIDTSRTGDKTSLVILVDESSAGESPFERMRLAHVKVWNPRDRESCPSGSINELLVEAHLDATIVNFPSLLTLKVDTRVMPWAKQLVVNCKRKPWGRRIDVFEGNTLQNSAMYLELLQRIAGSQGPEKVLRLFPHVELEAELLALRKKDLPAGGITVYDAGAGKDGRNRKVGGIHRDIAMSLAACCLLAAEWRLSAPVALSTLDELDQLIGKQMPVSPMSLLVGKKF